MQKILFLLIPAIVLSSETWATVASDSIAIPVDKGSDHDIFVGTGYGSDMMYSGLSVLKNQSFTSYDITYSYKDLITAYVCAYHLNGVTSTVAFYDMSLALSHTFNDTFDAAIAFAQYNTAPKLQDDYFGNSSFLTASLGVDWRILYTKTSYSYLFGSKPNHYLQLSNSHYFTTKALLNNLLTIWTDPSIDIVMGNRYTSYLRTIPAFPPVGGNPTTTVKTYKSDFGLIDAEISIPIAFNIKKTTLELSPLYYVPIHKDPDFPARSGLYFYANLYIKIK